LFKEKAIAWKRWRITKLEYDKNIYKTAAAKCSSVVKKYHTATAKELKLIRKNSVGSFYNYVNKKLCSPPDITDIRQPDGSLCTGDSDKCTVFNNSLAVYLLVMTAPPLNCALESIPHSSTWTEQPLINQSINQSITLETVCSTLKKLKLKPTTSLINNLGRENNLESKAFLKSIYTTLVQLPDCMLTDQSARA